MAQEKRFVKNLYWSLSFFSVFLILGSSFVVVFIAGIGQSFGWVFLPPAIGNLVVSLIFGYLFVSERVVLSDAGVEIFRWKKMIKACRWDGFKTIALDYRFRNPEIKFTCPDGTSFYLDDRKKIRDAISASLESVFGGERSFETFGFRASSRMDFKEFRKRFLESKGEYYVRSGNLVCRLINHKDGIVILEDIYSDRGQRLLAMRAYNSRKELIDDNSLLLKDLWYEF